jgi:hypothetical protein
MVQIGRPAPKKLGAQGWNTTRDLNLNLAEHVSVTLAPTISSSFISFKICHINTEAFSDSHLTASTS